MEFDDFLAQVRTQADAMRVAALAAGPDAEVPSCPDWTVRKLVRHIARVHNWVIQALEVAPDGTPPERAEDAPEDWDKLLAWWEDQLATMLDRLRDKGSDAPTWTFARNGTAGWWARRQAHEAAIHRLDAELAAGRDHQLLFEPELAADGIDEALTVMVPRRTREADTTGTVLFHAADAGRAWLVTLADGRPETRPATDFDADAAVVGTADAVYRAVWRRPSTAVITGDRGIVDVLRTP